jgi:hypothetical protein
MKRRTISKSRRHADGIFHFAGGAVELKGPVLFEHRPHLIDAHKIAAVIGKGMDREVGDGDGCAEDFGTAVNRQERTDQ